MLALGRLFAVVSCVLVAGVAQAQTLPAEQALNSRGLTRAWWGRAHLDPSQDTVQFLSADEAVLYVQSKTGGLTAFDAETGKRMWIRQLGPSIQAGFRANSNDSEVLVTAGMVLFSLDKLTGKTNWTLDLPHHPSAAPGVDDNNVYVPMSDASVYQFDLRTIHKLSDAGMLPQWSLRARGWRYQTARPVLSAPSSDNTLVTFASSSGTLYAVNAQGTKLKFQFEAGSAVTTPVAYRGDTIYICDVAGQVYCISAVTGVTRWTFSTSSPVRFQPRPVEDAVFVVAQRGGLYCLDNQTGVQKWRNVNVTEFVAVSNDRVYAADELGNLLILNRQTGKQEAPPLPVRDYPIRISNSRTDRIYLGTKDGLVVCVREVGLKQPIYHLYPDRRPILPELAPDEDAAATTEPAPANN